MLGVMGLDGRVTIMRISELDKEYEALKVPLRLDNPLNVGDVLEDRWQVH